MRRLQAPLDAPRPRLAAPLNLAADLVYEAALFLDMAAEALSPTDHEGA